MKTLETDRLGPVLLSPDEQVQPSCQAEAPREPGSPLGAFDPALVRRGVFRGVDLAALAVRFWGLEAMRSEGRVPKIRWRAFSRGVSAWGTAWVHSQRITMRLPGAADVESAAEVLLHELVHCSCPGGAHHGELFRRRLIACAREAFGLDLDTAALLALPVGASGKRAYAIDKAITEAMRASGVGERLRASASAAPVVQPAPTEPAEIEVRKEAARAAKAAERRAHCEAMLAEWESKAARAKRLVTKWKKRVRYYEKREPLAAKSRGES